MDTGNPELIIWFLKSYFKRLSVLVTQIPFEIRRLLLPKYMLFRGFKGIVHFDASGKKGFEVYREASRISIKLRKASKNVEKELFGVLGNENMLFLSGHDSEVRGGVFTCRGFAEQYGSQLPRNASVLTFDKPGSIGPFQIGEECEVKLTDISIYWLLGKKRLVKRIPFAWVFGGKLDLTKVNPIIHVESHFYSSLFGSIYQIATHGYTKAIDKDTYSKVFETFTVFVERIFAEFKQTLNTTKNDEQMFQQLLTRYKFFLSPGALSIEGQPVLNGTVSRKPDFCIKNAIGKTIYVEIEPPFCKPFEDSKMSLRLNSALKQISEWREILSGNGSAENITYLIIIGLFDDLNTDEKSLLEALNRTQKDLTIVTWDWLLHNISEVKEFVTKKLKQV